MNEQDMKQTQTKFWYIGRWQKLRIPMLVFFLVLPLTTALPQTQAQLPIESASTTSTTSTSSTTDQFGLSVAPPTAYLRVRPGTQAVHTMTVENTSPDSITIVPKVVDFTSDGQTGIPRLRDTTSFPYLVIPESGFPPVVIPAGQKAQMKLIIAPTADATEQEWPLTILFEQQPNLHNTTTSATSSKVAGTVGSNLIVLVSNQAEPPFLLKVKAIEVPKIVDSFRPVTFTPILANDGVAAVVSSGSAQVRSLWGKNILNQSLFPDVVLGRTTRAARAIDNAGSVGQANSAGTPNPQPTAFTLRPLLLGPYQVTIQLTPPDNTPLSTPPSFTTTFIALPLTILFAVVIGVIILICTTLIVKRALE